MDLALVVPFTGTFNGNGYAITKVTVDSGSGNVGFFGMNQGTIENLTIREAITSATTSSRVGVGGLVGAQLGGTITRRTVTGTVSRRATASSAGVGVHEGPITDSYATGGGLGQPYMNSPAA